jgi:hypothetical protein
MSKVIVGIEVLKVGIGNLQERVKVRAQFLSLSLVIKDIDSGRMLDSFAGLFYFG